MNGDGKDDIVTGARGRWDDTWFKKNKWFYNCLFSEKEFHTFTKSSRINLPTAFEGGDDVSKGVGHISTLVDFDGDGRKEFFAVLCDKKGYYVNSFDGRIVKSIAGVNAKHSTFLPRLFVTDYDGDGRTEVIYSYVNDSQGNKGVQTNFFLSFKMDHDNNEFFLKSNSLLAEELSNGNGGFLGGC